ncbi:MAG TPA: GcrA family cell cycle regulator [Microvirga sp.]|nr:GcrA family cell cycle regulator [Microvirga sp.]
METERKAGVRLWDLLGNSCHWPLGGLSERVEFFCGEPTKPGRPYCAEHQRRAFVRPYAARTRDKPATESPPDETLRGTRG